MNRGYQMKKKKRDNLPKHEKSHRKAEIIRIFREKLKISCKTALFLMKMKLLERLNKVTIRGANLAWV